MRAGAVAIVARRAQGLVCKAFIGPDEFYATEALIRKIVADYDVQEVAYDAQAFGRSADLLLKPTAPIESRWWSSRTAQNASRRLHRRF